MRSRIHYDLPTAVTFLMAGLGIGSLLAMLFAPRSGHLDVLPLESGTGLSSVCRI